MDSLASLAKATKGTKSNKREIVEGIFQWITENITYDIAAFNDRHGNTSDVDTNDLVADVLKSKKALCVGYSQLFDVLCR